MTSYVRLAVFQPGRFAPQGRPVVLEGIAPHFPQQPLASQGQFPFPGTAGHTWKP